MFARVSTPLRRAVLGHRRLLAFVLTALAVLALMRSLAPPPPATETVQVAARDLPAGRRLAAGDLTTRRLLAGTAPEGTVRRPQGRTLAGAVRRGEPITDVRLVGRSLAAPGLSAVPVRLPDAAMASLVSAGDHVDLYATDPSGGGTTTLASDVPVLAVPAQTQAGNGVTGALGGRLVVVGVPPDAVTRLTDASVRLFLTVAFRH